jgi:hypothetical protein
MTTNGRANKSKSTFRMSCEVGTNIKAPASKIWALLTNAKDFPTWNSTVANIDGTIALGETIQLKATIDPKRIFKLRISDFVAESRMVWRDGAAPMFQGVRSFALTPKGDGSTDFGMIEVFSGLMLPLIAGQLPDFGPIFEAYARDLKKAAESSV